MNTETVNSQKEPSQVENEVKLLNIHSQFFQMGIGEIAALVTAASYAGSSTIACHIINYTTPTMLNFLRGLLCIIIMCSLLLCMGEDLIPSCSLRTFVLFSLSGLFGIGIGESFFLKSLSLIGTRKTLLLETLAPPFTGIVAYFYSGTTLSLSGWAGMCITAAGIYIVINEKQPEQEESKLPLVQDQNTVTELADFSLDEQQISSKKASNYQSADEVQKNQNTNFWEDFSNSKNYTEFKGILNGFLFNFCQAMGVVLSHDASQSKEFTSLQTSFVRIIMGTLSLGLMLLFSQERLAWPWKTTQLNSLFVSGVLLGTFTGIWSQQVALANTRPEIAQTIIATTPLFGLVIGYFKGEIIKIQYIVGSIIAVVGVALIVWA